MFIADFFKISLETVQLVDQIQGDMGTPGFAFRLHLLRLEKLEPLLCPTA